MRSIERRLAVWLLGAACLGTALLGLAAYRLILVELNEAFDLNLAQVANTVADTLPPGEEIPAHATTRSTDPRVDAPIVVSRWTPAGQLLSRTDPGVATRFVEREGLTRQRLGSAEWDVYTVVRPDAVVQAAQLAAAQEREAAESAERLLLPFAALIAAFGALMIYALRRGLRPLDVATRVLAQRSAALLAPIDDRDMPREVRPLVGALNDLMARLHDAFDAQRRFVADAAHELRTPITALRLQLELVEGARDAAERERAMTELRAGIARAQHLVAQLLDLSRTEPGGRPQRLEPLDLAQLVRDAVARHSIRAERRGIDLGAQASQPVTLSGDRDELDLLLDNLVENALRYTDPGATVDVVALELDGAPVLRVIDNGPGIAPEDRDTLFRRFHRGESRPGQETAGSGLGLAIVKAIAERHGAQVGLHTAPSGHGLEVRVVFNAPQAAG
jgi:two-component system, OmpR family, sensor kinase